MVKTIILLKDIEIMSHDHALASLRNERYSVPEIERSADILEMCADKLERMIPGMDDDEERAESIMTISTNRASVTGLRSAIYDYKERNYV